MVKLDSILYDKGCDFMKIDVEGFEYAVIMGAINTILKYRPVIFYEKKPNTIYK